MEGHRYIAKLFIAAVAIFGNEQYEDMLKGKVILNTYLKRFNMLVEEFDTKKRDLPTDDAQGRYVIENAKSLATAMWTSLKMVASYDPTHFQLPNLRIHWLWPLAICSEELFWKINKQWNHFWIALLTSEHFLNVHFEYEWHTSDII